MLTGLLFTSVGAKPNLSTPSKLSPPIDQEWMARSRFGGEWKESQCAYPLPQPITALRHYPYQNEREEAPVPTPTPLGSHSEGGKQPE